MSDIEVAVLSRKNADLEADLATLRRGMVGQLSATGRLVKAIFALDDARFGGKHQRAATEGRSPGQDLVVAERIVESLERGAPDSVVTQELAAAILRAETAEMARQEAERAVSDLINGRSTADEIRRELTQSQEEVSRLQAQTLADREANARQVQDLVRSVAQVREALAREQDLHRADVAEARSLAAEISRLAGSDPEARKADDFEITLSLLAEALRNERGLDTIGSAAEAALVGWSRVLTDRAVSASQELSALRWQLDEARRRHEELQAAHDRLVADASRRAEQDRADAAAREVVTRELVETRLRATAAEEARLNAERSLAAREADLTAQRTEVDRLRAESAGREAERQRLQEAVRTAEATGRDTVARLQEVIDRARQAAQDAEHAAAEARGQLATAREEEARARGRADQLERESAQVRAAGEMAVAEAERTRRDTAAEVQRLSAKTDALERALAEAQATGSAAREAERQVRDQLAAAAARATQAEEAQRATAAALEAEQAQRAAIQAERDRLKEAVSSERRRTESETAEAKDRLQAEIQGHAVTTAERDRARADLAALTGEVAGLRAELARQAEATGGRLADVDGRRAEAEATARRLEARTQELEEIVTRLTAERDQQAQAERDRTARLTAASRETAELLARAEQAEAEAKASAARVAAARAEVRREFEGLLQAARAAVLKARAQSSAGA